MNELNKVELLTALLSKGEKVVVMYLGDVAIPEAVFIKDCIENIESLNMIQVTPKEDYLIGETPCFCEEDEEEEIMKELLVSYVEAMRGRSVEINKALERGLPVMDYGQQELLLDILFGEDKVVLNELIDFERLPAHIVVDTFFDYLNANL